MDFLEKTENLPQLVKDFFLSDEVRLELEKSCFMYGIKDEDIKKISGPIGLMFVGDLQLETLPKLIEENLNIHAGMPYGLAFEINQRIFARFPDYFRNSQDLLENWSKLKSNPIISEEQAWQKVLELEPWILEEEKEKAQEQKIEEEKNKVYQSQLEKLPIDIAVKRYPEVGEQLITSNYISLKSFFEPVRPSIKNWLADYTFNVGISNHDPVTRGNYLFKNENAKKLSPIDRDKLSQILKSFEEKTPLSINTKSRQVVFSAIVSQERPVPTVKPNATPAFSPTTLRNDFQQKIQQAQKEKIYPQRQRISIPEERKNNYPEKPRTFQTDEDRLSAWRQNLSPARNATHSVASGDTSNIRFSSPQKFSIEQTTRPTEIPRAIPQNNPIRIPQTKNIPTPTRPIMKNVVNLREE